MFFKLVSVVIYLLLLLLGMCNPVSVLFFFVLVFLFLCGFVACNVGLVVMNKYPIVFCFSFSNLSCDYCCYYVLPTLLVKVVLLFWLEKTSDVGEVKYLTIVGLWSETVCQKIALFILHLNVKNFKLHPSIQIKFYH